MFIRRAGRIYRVSAAASWRSYLLVAVLAFGVVFSLLYAAPQLARPGHAHSDIPTEPKISQLQALNIVEKHVRSEIDGIEEIKLAFFMYNFSDTLYSSDSNYAEYRSKLRFGWNFTHIKNDPELLGMPLMFVHANGTSYAVNSTNHSYEKVCDEPLPTCPMGRILTEASRDRLVYRAETAWLPFSQEIPINYGDYAIDAETGEIVWNTIDYERNRKPMPSVNFESKTIAQLFRERLDPPETAQATIVRGASNPDYGQDYLPKEIRVTLGIDNRIVWTNTDVTAHTVVSDDGHASQYTGKFESGTIEPNSTFEYTFFDDGYYAYHCEIHPHMKGAIEVIQNFAG